MLSQTTNFSVTPNLARRRLSRTRNRLQTGGHFRDDGYLDVICPQPGDVFGFEAIADAKVLLVKRNAIEALAARNSDVARQVWAMTGRELQRTW